MTRWLDFSGAPPLIVPAQVAHLWRGGEGLSGVSPGEPTAESDYERACAAAWPGRNLILVGGMTALAIYTEFDNHTWISEKNLLISGNWIPSDADLQNAEWTDPVLCDVVDPNLLLISSPADWANDANLLPSTKIHLPLGRYIVEYAYIVGERVVIAYRFTRNGAAESAA